MVRIAVTEEPYGYGGSDPANGADPSGMDPISAGMIVYLNSANIDALHDSVAHYVCRHYDPRHTEQCNDTGQVNALRHFIGSTLLTYIFTSTYGVLAGLEAANLVLQAHELDGFCKGLRGAPWTISGSPRLSVGAGEVVWLG